MNFDNTRRKGRPLALVAIVSAAVVALAACSSGSDIANDSESSTSVSTTEALAAVTVPDSAVGKQIAWLLNAVNMSTSLTPEETSAHFGPNAPVVLTPADFDSMRAGKPCTTVDYKGGVTDGTVSITSTTGGHLDMNVVVDGNGLIAGMAITPTPEPHVPAASWQELATAVKALPAPTNLTVIEVTGGKNAEVFSVGDTSPQPTGSTIKLYVLGAVATAVKNGTLSWDQKLTITDDLKSMPGGTMQDLPSGTEVTVRETAGKMISISDNTATDMLIAALGHEQVESTFVAMGMADPSRNIPLKPTRALFQLGCGGEGAQRISWRDGTPDERRVILAALSTGLVDIPPTAFTSPAWPFYIDWFATPADLRAALVSLQEMAKPESGAPIRDILAEDPALSDESAKWFTYGGFKGGSSIGVLAGTWYLEHDDRAWVVTMQTHGEDAALVADPKLYFDPTDDAMLLIQKDNSN
ncbi:serine hydrolase [Rhodococcus sp. IEGM 1379]|uniref:serine hydrolase n=1 Tax=Rhodococcus sp. IEGM 1379 TaxID=3047086 RepID=UPI0024B76E0A|nr:serine hydrolase [Rhodococcus sp. IEGM 1379]MDI9915269.1 serine hydrolase [Rhodococcus sp. IEGM 1379]